jgi:glutamyl-tRNA synthetase|eukprot:CAMPEP_0174285186 /NCGR_PEP_ID=MMETSP0809-20121228/7984_1 /TAXON_ID=73025 ORGANISM="Eutreptiella gymnastica-like, Strain CCMP1594" /NCGR_SAMPLE_ID=MMETSP0809 /ASSEMBLY_ACC=CAM_ASM_000658 /LENGTH=684 /DNA_ID=CAMNT_0015380885 /DNA_START=22 /DNA_END=2076 /DNA_ORIENTATION=+
MTLLMQKDTATCGRENEPRNSARMAGCLAAGIAMVGTAVFLHATTSERQFLLTTQPITVPRTLTGLAAYPNVAKPLYKNTALLSHTTVDPDLSSASSPGSSKPGVLQVQSLTTAPKSIWGLLLLVPSLVLAYVWRSPKPEPLPETFHLGDDLRIAVMTATGERTEAPAPTTTGPMRTRFAPSPTGSLHVGGARTALYNWLMAKKTGGQFVLRIEDTDVARSTRESEDSMTADLKWLGLQWDEGPGTAKEEEMPFRQSERGSIYHEMAEKLMQQVGSDGKPVAYKCFCTQEELDAKKAKMEESGEFEAFVSPWRDASEEEVAAKVAAGEEYAVRFRVPPGKRVEIDDIVRGQVGWDAQATIGDFILLRSSGVPVYNFCVAVDDALMGISHVIRAEEHLTNTLRQGLILEALEFAMPTYAHCALILGEDGSKLSKRHGATSVSQFAEEGFVPSAMINYLVGLGWNDGTDKEVYTVEEIIEAFSMDRVQKSPSVFDMTKLKWINGQHLRLMEDAELAGLLGPFLEKEGLAKAADSPIALTAAVMCKQKIELLADAVPLVRDALGYQLTTVVAENKKAAKLVNDGFKGFAAAVVGAYNAGEIPDPTSADFPDAYGTWAKGFLDEFAETVGKKSKKLMQPLRLAMTGEMSGPDVGQQLRLVALAQAEGISCVPLEARMAELQAFIEADE